MEQGRDRALFSSAFDKTQVVSVVSLRGSLNNVSPFEIPQRTLDSHIALP
jgi:hypothetical protein